ncbi:MAG: (2Fe-2S)-binding protein [bacterium]|nr:(2Fe-2S)-binding protein [bacterium]
MLKLEPERSRAIALSVNGKRVEVEVNCRDTLVDALREKLGLTGTHVGCEQGICGACTVIVDGSPARACLVLALQAEGSSVTTIEGLSHDGEPSRLQQACMDATSFQCAFCAPGILVSLTWFLDETPSPTRSEIKMALAGNLCRCTGYASIVDGVERALNDPRSEIE